MFDASTTDAALVSAVRTGSPGAQSAFSVLVTRHEGWVLALLTGLLGSRSDAEDVAQETFLRAYRGLRGLAEGAAFRGWLRRIAVNQAYNSRRRQRPTPVAEVSEIPVGERQSAYGERQALLLALGKLRYEEREVLTLRYLEDLKVEEIAQTLGLSLSATKMRLSRARTAFKATYVDEH